MLATFACIALMAATAPTAWPDGDHPARAFLVAENDSFAPGEATRIGVRFEIDREWYLYWDGLNDSGFAPEIKLTLPPGYSAGEILWPAPKRKISPGEILDHIYERELLLMIPIHVPEDARPGDAVNISADVDWLVCREACIPGRAQLSLTVPITKEGEAPQPARYGNLFANTTARLPQPLHKQSALLTMARDGDAYTFTTPKAVKMAFYPANECARLRNLLEYGEVKKNTLKLHLARPDESVRIQGIVEVWTDEKTSSVVWIDTGPASKPANPDSEVPVAAD